MIIELKDQKSYLNEFYNKRIKNLRLHMTRGHLIPKPILPLAGIYSPYNNTVYLFDDYL